ncbi:MAG: DUF4089 domain-containing protein [Burkholderiales bacterium]|jgi:hypothetical protein|nr:DUF4089 domain-containing protein [Burkholderiales bacterium]
MRAAVSEPTPDEAQAWLAAASRVVGLDIPPELRAGVAAQLLLNHRLVAPLLAFEIPGGTAPAPRFEP